MVFVVPGDIDFIAQILSMFFMVTYGALCTVSFLEYFAGNPSYRPTFHSRWYVSLLGAIMCALMMIQMSFQYSLLAITLMAAIYFGLRRTRKGERDLTAIFQGTMFQLTRRLQITLQKNQVEKYDGGWRPSIVAVTRFGDRRLGHFDLLRWISHRHGFGHFIQYFQVEFDKAQSEGISETAEGVRLAHESMFNVLVLRSTNYRFGYRSSIHLWATEENLTNAPLMLLLA